MPDRPAAVAMTQHRTHSVGSLVDALDSIIDGGAAVVADVVICVAGVELIQVDLRALVMAVSAGSVASSDAAAEAMSPSEPS